MCTIAEELHVCSAAVVVSLMAQDVVYEDFSKGNLAMFWRY